MWTILKERLPSTMVILYAAVTVVLPWLVYKINQSLHQHGDPPWKGK